MEIRLNIGYFKSFQGIVKIVQLVRISVIQQCLFLSCLMQQSAASMNFKVMLLIFMCISNSVMESYSKKGFVSKAFLFVQANCVYILKPCFFQSLSYPTNFVICSIN